MDDKTAARAAYSWGSRFHLAVEVESGFGKSYKTACDKLRDPKKVVKTAPWGAIPQVAICEDCKARETAELKQAEFCPNLKLWGAGEGGGVDLVALVGELSQDWTYREREGGWLL